VAAGEFIVAEWANETLDDLASAMTDSLDRYGRGGMLAPFKFLDGTVLAPGLTFTNEPTTGFYRESLGVVGLSLQGVEAWKATSAGLTAKEFFATTTTPTGGNSLVSKDQVTTMLAPYQLTATAWNTSNFDPNTKQNVSTAWNTSNFNPAQYAFLPSGLNSFAGGINCNTLFASTTVRAASQVRAVFVIATPSP
jgi:hypothetical protein